MRGNGIPSRVGTNRGDGFSRVAARAWPGQRTHGLRCAPSPGRLAHRLHRSGLRTCRALLRARLQIQPAARLRARNAGAGGARQRIRPAIRDLFAGPASLAALPPRHRLRPDAASGRRALSFLSRPGRTRRRLPRHPRAHAAGAAAGIAGSPVRAAVGSRRMSLLADLYRGGWLRTVDHAFAESLRRLRPDTPDAVLAAAALCGRAVAQGHSQLPLAQVGELLLDLVGDREPPTLPALDDWCAQLRASPFVGTGLTATNPAENQPDEERVAAHAAPAVLVLEGEALSLRRYWKYETRLATAISKRAAPST